MNIREQRKKHAKNKCELCGMKGSEMHHIFGGLKNRKISECFDTVIWLCSKCHKNIHNQDFIKKKELQVERCNLLIEKIGEKETRKLLGKIYIRGFYANNYI